MLNYFVSVRRPMIPMTRGKAKGQRMEKGKISFQLWHDYQRILTTIWEVNTIVAVWTRIDSLHHQLIHLHHPTRCVVYVWNLFRPQIPQYRPPSQPIHQAGYPLGYLYHVPNHTLTVDLAFRRTSCPNSILQVMAAVTPPLILYSQFGARSAL